MTDSETGKVASSWNKFLEACRPYSGSIVRIAMALVFLWFGISQIVSPDTFMGYLPSWALAAPTGGGMMGSMNTMMHSMVQLIPGKATGFLAVNGIVEIILGTFLLLGYWRRTAAALLGLHLLAIAISLGYNDVAIRDVGLSLATFSAVFASDDPLTLKNLLKRQPQ